MDALGWEAVPEGKEALEGVKSAAEIAQYEVDERLSETERVNVLLTGGHAIQERRAIDSLPSLLSDKGRAAWEAVQANLAALLRQRAADADTQVAVAEALRAAVQQRALPAAAAAECLLPLAVSRVPQAGDSADEVAAAWEALLVELLPVLPASQLAEVVLPLALAKGRVNEPVASRVSCCRLLGAMVPHAQPGSMHGVLQRFAPQLLAACQDTDYQVRMAAAQQLPALARALGPGATVAQLLPELIELLEDDEVQVRMLAFSSLVAFCSLVNPEQRRSQLLPAVRRHMQPLELALPLQRTLAAAFPELLATIRDDLEPSDAGMLYGCFRHLAARADVELRVTCASRLPALMAAPLAGSSPSYLHDTWSDLAADHDMQVRTAIACQLHAVARTVAAADAARLLQRPLVALLRDSSTAVREALLPGLGETFRVLSRADELHKPGLACELHKALQVLVAGLGASWRPQQHVAAALPALPGLLSSDALAEHWAPYAFALLLSGPACVKPAAATGLACLLRGLQKERQRTELHCRLIRELACGRSCWARLAYVQLCGAALHVFSCRWFKQHLLEAVVELLADGVPTVRLAALGLLPALKQTIRLPEDVEQLEQLNTAMSSLMTDNDRDVSHAARCVHESFKRTPLHVTGGAGLLNLSGAAEGAAEFEAADQVKEEEEQQLTLAQDEMERLRVEWCASAPERRSRRLCGLAIAGDGGASSSSSGHQGLLRKNNSKGRMESSHAAGVGAGSGGGSAASGRGGAALAGLAGASGGAAGLGRGGSGTSAGCGWGQDSSSRGAVSSVSSDRRFGSGLASSSNNTSSSAASAGSAGAGSGQFNGRGGSHQPPAASAASRPCVLRGGVAAAGSGGGGLSVATSPRHPGSAAAAGGGGPRSPKPGVNGGGSGGGLAGSQPLTSPTGSNPFGSLRLPVLAGSAKAASVAAGARWPTDASSGSGSGGASPASSLGSSLGAPSSSRIGAAAAAAASASSSFGRSAMPGSLAAAAGAVGAPAAALGSSKGGGAGASGAASKSGLLASSTGASRLLGISSSSAPASAAAQHANNSSASTAAVAPRFR